MRSSSASSWIIFLVSAGIGGLILAPILVHAPASAMGEGSCPHQMSYDVSSFQINNGTQTFDLSSNQQPITFDALYSRGYDVNFVVHTHHDPSPNNSTGWRQATNQTFIQYTSDLYNFFNGICAPAKPDSTFTVTYNNVEANSKAINPGNQLYMAGIMSYSDPAIKYTWYVHWIAQNSTASAPSNNATSGNATGTASAQPVASNTVSSATPIPSNYTTTTASVPSVKGNGTTNVASTTLASGRLGSFALLNDRLYTLSGNWSIGGSTGVSGSKDNFIANVTLTDMENGGKQEISISNSAPINSTGYSAVIASASNSFALSVRGPATVQPLSGTEVSSISSNNATLYALTEPGTAFNVFKLQLQSDHTSASMPQVIYGFVSPDNRGPNDLLSDLG